MPKDITIGDTFQRTYRFYQPLASDPTKADKSKPVDLTGQTVVFCLKRGNRETQYTSPDDLTVTAAEGKIEVHISSEKTALLRPASADSYIVFQSAGQIRTKARQRERIIA